MCMNLPSIIEDVIKNSTSFNIPKDTVFDELKSKERLSFELSLYMLAFESYIGFQN